MKYIRSLTNRASTWAFLVGITLVPAIAAVRDAVYANFTSGLFNFSAAAMSGALIALVYYWVSQTRADMRHEAEEAATYAETSKPIPASRLHH